MGWGVWGTAKVVVGAVRKRLMWVVGCVWKEDGKSGGWCRMEEVNVGCVEGRTEKGEVCTLIGFGK